MELKLSRSEKKGMFGGTKYILHAKLDLSPEEVAILKKDKSYYGYPMFQAADWQRGDPWWVNPEALHLGRDIEAPSLGDQLIAETSIKEACKKLHTRIKVTSHVQANPEETINFDD